MMMMMTMTTMMKVSCIGMTTFFFKFMTWFASFGM